MAVLQIEIDDSLYSKYKNIVKRKNQMLSGYNRMLFEKAIMKEIKNSDYQEDIKNNLN